MIATGAGRAKAETPKRRDAETAAARALAWPESPKSWRPTPSSAGSFGVVGSGDAEGACFTAPGT